jgi:hypothetical protein
MGPIALDANRPCAQSHKQSRGKPAEDKKEDQYSKDNPADDIALALHEVLASIVR